VHNERDPRLNAIPDIHGHAKGEHKPYAEERPLPLTARMLFLWFYHACRRGFPRFLMVTDHINYLTFEDPASVNLVRRALKLAQAGDLYGAAETANVDVGHAAVVSEGLRRGMRYSIGAEVDNDPRARPDAQNIVDAMRPDGLVRSVHFIPIDHPIHGAGWNWAFDNPEFASLFDHVGTEKTWEGYMTVLLDAIERLPGNIVGHFYVPAVFGHWPDDATLERYEDRMLDAVAERGMAVEFNTRFLYRDASDEQKQRYLDANRRLLRKAKERGVGIAVGSDAHSPKDQAGAFETVLAVLDELEINEIVFPIGGRLARVALRYVKPAEPEPPPPPPPAPEPERIPARAAAAAAPPVEVEPEPAVVPAKPVRKARPGASSARPKETLPERSPERHVDDAAFEPPAAPPDPVAADAAPPAPPKRAPKKVAPPKPAPVATPAAPPAPPAPPVKAAAKPVAKPAVKPVAKPVAKPAAKPSAKPAGKPPAKPVHKPVAKIAKPATPPAKAGKVAAKPAKASSKNSKPPAKAVGKPAVKAKTTIRAAAKPAAKKPAPAKRSAGKPAPAKKAAPKKAAPKKPARPAKAPAKKAAAKKTAAKKPVARKPVAKKAPAKKSPAKRR
jgi:HisJ family histidinol phosphate phosphatase